MGGYGETKILLHMVYKNYHLIFNERYRNIFLKIFRFMKNLTKNKKTILISAIALTFISILFFLGRSHLNTENENVPFFNNNYVDQREFYKGIVLEIQSEDIGQEIGDHVEQLMSVSIQSGDRKGEIVTVHNQTVFFEDGFYLFRENDKVILMNYKDFSGEEKFYISEYDRSGGIFFIVIFFLITILYFGRMRGFGAMLGLSFSFLVLFFYMVPSIVAGANIMHVTLLGAFLMSSVSLFLAHGINKRIAIVWLSTITTLSISITLSFTFVRIAGLFGRGSDLLGFHMFTDYSYINLRELLLAGIIIGVLGVLSDITSTQTAVIWELKKADPNLQLKDLYSKSLNVGRQHIASSVNTLVLVYAGVSFPLFIAIKTGTWFPLWVIINSEPIAEEIVRIVIGTSSLILAVPISSIIASYLIGRIKEEDIKNWDNGNKFLN